MLLQMTQHFFHKDEESFSRNRRITALSSKRMVWVDIFLQEQSQRKKLLIAILQFHKLSIKDNIRITFESVKIYFPQVYCTVHCVCMYVSIVTDHGLRTHEG